jgi:dynein heavy chain, axonemal
MFSCESERVPFDHKVNPRDVDNMVEVWMSEVEKVMKSSIKTVISRSIHDHGVTEREKWVLAWPGQVVLFVSGLKWTQEVAQALESKSSKALQKYEERLNENMEKLVALVRGDLSSLARISLSSLLVHDVHARDVVSRLNRDRVSSISDFDFLSQLRYYWEDKTVSHCFCTGCMSGNPHHLKEETNVRMFHSCHIISFRRS